MTTRQAGVRESRSPESADLDFAVGDELIGRDCQVGRGWSLANAARGIVLRAVAGAEEAVVIALMGDRDATQMGADADHDQPLVMALLDPRLIRLRIGKTRDRHLASLVDLLLGAVADVDRLAAPEHLDVLPFGDRRQIDFDRRAGRDGRGVRVHLGNEGPDRDHSADRSGGSRCNKKEITACRIIRRRRCRHDSKPFLVCSRWNRPRIRIYQPEEAAGARAPRGGRKTTFPAPIGRNKQSRIVLLAPLPEERKPAIGTSACNALNPRGAVIYSDISWGPLAGMVECSLRFSSPTFPRTPGRFCVFARASTWPPILSSPPVFRCRTGTSAGPAWTIWIG